MTNHSENQTPINFSDYALVYGSQVCGLLAGVLTWEEGLLKAFIAACNGLLMGTFLLLIGLLIIRQPPALLNRVLQGEPIDDVKRDRDDS